MARGTVPTGGRAAPRRAGGGWPRAGASVFSSVSQWRWEHLFTRVAGAAEVLEDRSSLPRLGRGCWGEGRGSAWDVPSRAPGRRPQGLLGSRPCGQRWDEGALPRGPAHPGHQSAGGGEGRSVPGDDGSWAGVRGPCRGPEGSGPGWEGQEGQGKGFSPGASGGNQPCWHLDRRTPDLRNCDRLNVSCFKPLDVWCSSPRRLRLAF